MFSLNQSIQNILKIESQSQSPSYVMIHTIGDVQVPIARRLNARAKRLILRQDPVSQGFVLTMPPRVSDSHIQRFLESTEGWILKKVAQQQVCSNMPFVPGAVVSLLGKEYPLVHQPAYRAKGVTLLNGILEVQGPLDEFSTLVLRYSQKLAAQELGAFCQQYAAALNVTFSKMTLKTMKSRWGSCSSEGAIVLNWRLVFAPLAVARYVCAHEVAHLLEMNHSDRFWSLVSQLDPTYANSKKWLRKYGQTLHQYGQ